MYKEVKEVAVQVESSVSQSSEWKAKVIYGDAKNAQATVAK